MAVPPMLVDSHVHVASSDEDQFPRQPTGAGSTWWQHPSGVDELLAHLDASGVERAVVVQAVGVYGYDCTYAAAAAASNDRLALVGAVDMSGPDPESSFDELHRSTDLAGLRLFGVSAAGAGWLTDGAGAAVWDLAARTGCVLVPTIFGDALPALRRLMEQFPDVAVALDHSAFPDLGGPDAMPQLLAMADLPRLNLKVTSHNLDTDDDPARFVDALAEAFGPDRLCWGSDHPQHQTTTYPDMVAIARTAARNLTAVDRSSFLGGNARRLWWPTPHVDAPSRPEAPDGP